MASSSSSSASTATEVDVAVWRAIAGVSVHVPPLNSYVYYFPQGHMEHFPKSTFVRNFNFTLKRPFIPCQVLSVRFFCNLSDQVLVKFLLQPFEQRLVNLDVHDEDDEDDVVSFAKVLTPSDANNGGGFSVPRYCADLIFPGLDFTADPPVQNLVLKDTHNNAWEFRHIYRGTPRRHLLTTGWGNFVKAKHLVAGDSVVFMRKNSTNEMLISIRRASRSGSNDCQDIGKAIENAAKGLPFEVVYYPRFGLPDFVVRAEKVEAALRTPWSAGMRVKMAVEADELQRKTWFQGTIMVVNGGPRCKTPWRMLQVTWDEPESRMLNVNGVNPWQVEQVKPTSLFDTFFQPNKRLRLPQHLMNHTPSCADMQGARRSRILSSGDELPLKRTEPDVATKVPTLVAYSDNVSAGTSSVQFCGTSQPGRTSSSTKDGRPTSFQLFGKVIQVSKS